ncbi:MAG: hypothetical protein HDR80_02170 [Bacteroides sp.]|nr:hypothetical protein [Bacteroides sp.]
MLNAYLKPKKGTVKSIIDGIKDGIADGNPEKFMQRLEAYFAGILYEMKIADENNFHNVIYVLTTLIGIDTDTEVHTSDGSIDLKIETQDYLYIMELKYERSAREALRQIEEKLYARPWQTVPGRFSSSEPPSPPPPAASRTGLSGDMPLYPFLFFFNYLSRPLPFLVRTPKYFLLSPIPLLSE